MMACGRNLPNRAISMRLSAISSHFFDVLNFSSVPSEYAEMSRMKSMMIPGTMTVVR